MLIILFIVSGLLPSPSVLHFTFPPTWCQLASLCNHTGIPECAKERDESHIRIFLDSCDMFEYNCDNHKEYNEIDFLNCQHTTKVTTQSTTPTTTTTQCTRHENTTTPMTKSTSSITTATTIYQTTPSTTITNNTVTETTIKTTLNQTESTTKQSMTTDSKTSTTEALTTEPTTKKPITVLPTTKVPTTIVSTTIESTTLNHTIKSNCTRNENKTILTTQMTPTRSNVTKQVTESLTTVAQSTLKETTIMNTVEYEEVEVSKDVTEEKVTTTTPLPSLIVCDNYPKDCNRPSTWDTTAKGETRDFYQILRAKYGDRVKLLRATTHWPRRYVPYDVDGTFMFGRHSET